MLSKIFGFFRRCTSCFACFLIGERYGKICRFDDWLILDGAGWICRIQEGGIFLNEIFN